jgi:hypothetical protein
VIVQYDVELSSFLVVVVVTINVLSVSRSGTTSEDGKFACRWYGSCSHGSGTTKNFSAVARTLAKVMSTLTSSS